MPTNRIAHTLARDDAPSLTVVIPVWNRRDMVLNALQSVMTQDCDDNIEIIVVDDGSTDDTVDVIKTFLVQRPVNGRTVFLIQKLHSGISATIARGIREAHGRHICLLGSDDLWEPMRARELLDEERRLGDSVLIHTNWKVVDNHLSLLSLDGAGSGTRAPQTCCTPAQRHEAVWGFVGNCFRRFSLHGGTVIFPRSMLQGENAIPDDIVNEDFWITLVAYLTLPIHYLATNSLKVRTHPGEHHRLAASNLWPRIAEQEVNLHNEMIRLLRTMSPEDDRTIDFLVLRRDLLHLRQMANHGQRITCAAKTLLLFPRCLAARGLLRTAISNLIYCLDPKVQSQLRN